MVTPGPTAAELRFWGVSQKEAAEWATIEVWPDNMAAASTFVAMLTQWRSGSLMPTGLDYGVLPTVLRLRGVPRKQWSEIFEQIRILEDAAIQTMNRLAEQERERQRNRRG